MNWTPAAVTVSFDAGGAAEGEAPAPVVKWAGCAFVLPGPGTLAAPPCVFAGWSDGTTVYAAGETYVFGSANVTLTAIWSLKTWTLAEAVDAPVLGFATGGAANWTVDTAGGWTNGVSAKSGAVANGEMSWIETAVSGAGTLVFRWKVLGGVYRGNPFAFAKVEVDGTNVVQTYLAHDWEERTLTIEGPGTHAIRWTWLRTSARNCDGDCAWLDGVSWTLSVPATEVVVEGVEIPVTWLDENAASVIAAAGGNYEEAARSMAANGVNTVWECYVAGISPTNAAERFLVEISFDENGFPVVEWSPDLGDARGYVVEGTASLEDGWGDWDDDSRFFRVRVAMPGVFENYAIAFDTDGGSEIPSITTNFGALVTAPPDPTKDGCDFAGWSPSFPATMPKGGATLTAQWTPLSYMVIDLSPGADAGSYSVTYLAEPPSGGFNTDEYKTTKLVLCRLYPGPIPTRNATITKPFYVGLFEVTQKQYELITGSNPSYFSGDTRPVEQVSYDAIRGSSLGAQWPASNAVDADSFLGKLRARTGIDFDLPTEVQWEYACRAGTTTTYSYGNSADGAYMWYRDNSSSQTHEVGTKLPNPWGLYDMHGNVEEWCLDWSGGSLSGNDPIGSSSGSFRVWRGGEWGDYAGHCTSSYRYDGYPSDWGICLGFRLVRALSE